MASSSTDTSSPTLYTPASDEIDKITDKIAALPHDATFFSLEFFPPKTQIVCVLYRFSSYRR